ncbi:imidazoleglycerol-phosphate dehydratase HisB [Patescibacteria group bacterium]|nr:imidazoleglycerol-phosphate dehydratase HisB [Patescibacteria group bacterium]
MKRKISHHRKTKETNIKVDLNVDGKGKNQISISIPFFNHLLSSFSKHGLFDLKIKAKGDLEIDQHHTVEDIGISLGEAFGKALGNKKGINRSGFFAFPMDEALAIVAVDISGRALVNFDAKFSKEKIGDLESDVIKEFFWGFARALEATIHIRLLYGENDHHKSEAMFKAFGKAMKMACSKDKRILQDLPTTKGII